MGEDTTGLDAADVATAQDALDDVRAALAALEASLQRLNEAGMEMSVRPVACPCDCSVEE